MNILDLVIIVLLLLSTLNGLRQGLIHALENFLGWLVALFVAFKYHDAIQPWMQGLSTDPIVQKSAAFIFIVITVILITWIIGYFLQGIFKQLKLTWLNRLAGGAFGLAKSLVIFLILIHILAPWFANTASWKNSKVVAILQPYAAITTQYSQEIVQISTEAIESH